MTDIELQALSVLAMRDICWAQNENKWYFDLAAIDKQYYKDRYYDVNNFDSVKTLEKELYNRGVIKNEE